MYFLSNPNATISVELELDCSQTFAGYISVRFRFIRSLFHEMLANTLETNVAVSLLHSFVGFAGVFLILTLYIFDVYVFCLQLLISFRATGGSRHRRTIDVKKLFLKFKKHVF